jgi:hypothetical protein
MKKVKRFMKENASLVMGSANDLSSASQSPKGMGLLNQHKEERLHPLLLDRLAPPEHLLLHLQPEHQTWQQ